MFYLLIRQKRRLGLYALTVCLPIFLGVASFGASLDLQPHEITVALSASGVGLLLLPILILLLLPSARHIIDLLAFILPVLAILAVPAAALQHIPAVGYTLLAVATLWTGFVLSGRFLPMVFKPRDFVAQHTFRSTKTVYTLWAEHLPDPALIDRHWCRDLEGLKLDRLEPHIRVATYRTPQGTRAQRQSITSEETYDHFYYDFVELVDGETAGATGSYGIALAKIGKDCAVTLSLNVHKLPFPAWLGVWLDDLLGDEADHHVARETGRTDFSITSRSNTRPSLTPERAPDPIAVPV